ncbi:hypothetical protein, partial [Mycolicibacter algericus]|uniref:hypothetical protein n=1 Tax=Mycolicibacter algericus TaxID=1288388 RepID=UPI001A97F8CF
MPAFVPGDPERGGHPVGPDFHFVPDHVGVPGRVDAVGYLALPVSECVDPVLKLAGVDQGSQDVV